MGTVRCWYWLRGGGVVGSVAFGVGMAGVELAIANVIVAVKESIAGQRIIRVVKLFGGGKLAEGIIAVFPIAPIGFGGLDLLIGAVVLVVKRGDVASLEELVVVVWLKRLSRS